VTHVTCRLTAKNRDQLRNRTLGSRVWATFTFSVLGPFRQGGGRFDWRPAGLGWAVSRSGVVNPISPTDRACSAPSVGACFIDFGGGGGECVYAAGGRRSAARGVHRHSNSRPACAPHVPYVM